MNSRKTWSQFLLIIVAFLFLGAFLLLPLIVIFAGAFSQGLTVFLAAINEPAARSAIQLTLLVTVITVPLQLLFGLSAAWLLTKFRFRGRQLLITLIEVPFAVSPVIAGLVFILLYGVHGFFGEWLQAQGFQIIFAVPGIVLATMFVTLPFIARELIPLMEAQGSEAEEASLTLGAGGWRTFWHVTLPAIKWGLLYGVILCSARAIGEFGAVSVVSGRIRGQTNTMPLHIEILYNEYQFTASFAVAALMSLFALVTIGVKQWVEWRQKRRSYDDLTEQN
ncbi:sulfate ABC transporter permease subunit CysW [Shouchella clausii]|uniref:Sulfate ABC transporter permease subunit CysW n=2 Tax=Shouchella TaxID=2893057 RepID=A0A268NV86_SHOCL|nr:MULTISPECIES: sulfate ABC transporter permease subunit CysW [Shouchella]MCM3311565.1 sulfate ABC transporter permease subunit CysW [Psychrobacillus sp. MER TA 17]KKI85551.1 sulfate ABC transporter permease [Shouchella clausii]MBU3232929.1 sulfate ABC transporter permease subunit CysW [Shouchella clausii]MBU3264615.1 sulfate ABC transporter permease subunit CysW [Shouchella clausii]MBU3508869.1 sulfate ABC transporter permease subunit CysW [Shouchella clausii]